VEIETAFDQYGPIVYSFAYRMTRREDVAEDIVQETFLAVSLHPERFAAERGTMKTYLFAIARNLVLKRFRQYSREEQLDDENEEHIPSVDLHRGLAIAVAVATAIESLPPLQREVIILFEYGGFSLQELSVIAACEVGTVKSRLHRARTHLKQLLAPCRTEVTSHGTH